MIIKLHIFIWCSWSEQKILYLLPNNKIFWFMGNLINSFISGFFSFEFWVNDHNYGLIQFSWLCENNSLELPHNMQMYSQISRSSVHRWKLISGFGSGQSYSGPLDNGSAIHTHTYRGRERGKDQNCHNDTQNKTTPLLPLCPSFSLLAGSLASLQTW